MTAFRENGEFSEFRLNGSKRASGRRADRSITRGSYMISDCFGVCLAKWISEARHAAKVSVWGAQSSIVSAVEPPNAP